MQAYPQGKVAPVTAGTPVRLAAPPSGTLVAEIQIAQIAGTTGSVYFGKVGMVKGTFVGVMRQFMAPGATGFLDSENYGDGETNRLDPTDYCVDADTNLMGMLVTYIQA
jgi:hypothetical protein